jgi:hypothetical protein
MSAQNDEEEENYSVEHRKCSIVFHLLEAAKQPREKIGANLRHLLSRKQVSTLVLYGPERTKRREP